MSFFTGNKTKTHLIVGCTTLDHVPGNKITCSLGVIEHTEKDIGGDAAELIPHILQTLLQEAVKAGAHAVVNVKISTGTYQQQGSGWDHTYITAYGDAVMLERVDN